MSFVGTRPEVTKYVKKYTKEMRATLLLPAGITSEASIQYKDEAELLDAADDVDRVYVEKVLPEKMKYNLESIRKFSFLREIATPHMFRHSFATYLIEEGVDVSCIQQILGHSSIKTTQIYIHVAARKQAEILQRYHPRNAMKIKWHRKRI